MTERVEPTDGERADDACADLVRRIRAWEPTEGDGIDPITMVREFLAEQPTPPPEPTDDRERV